MAKRQADTDLNHDNWDQEYEKEEAGTFRPVEEQQLQNRVIKKAKRTLNRDSSFPSPFSAFSGFTSKASSSPGSFFNLEKKLETLVSNAATKEDTEEKSNGCTASSTVATVDNNDDNSANNNESKISETGKGPAQAKKSSSSNRSLDYFRQLQTLNESVLKWMQIHIAKNPCCDFTPVFNDYKNHLKKLESKYPDNKSSTAQQSSFLFSGASTSASKVFDAGTISSSSSCDVPENFKPASPQDDQMGYDSDSHEKSKEMKYGAGFASNTTNTSTFSYGVKKVALTATSTGSPIGPTSSFEAKNENAPQPAFSFGIKSNFYSGKKDDSATADQKPFSFAVASAKEAESKPNEDEYVPPKNDFTTVKEENAVYSKRCKLFFKKGDSYADKGVGTLYVKPIDEKMQLVIRADTNLGNILLNILLSASLPMERTGKNNVLIVCIPNPPLDPNKPDSKEAIPILIRVKTREDADELLEVLNKHKS